MIGYLAIFIVLAWLLFLIGVVLIKPKKKESIYEEITPFVSIIIALRNESGNVSQLCKSLNQLSYPKSSFEILFGDDDSDDQTVDLLKESLPENASIIKFGMNETGHFGKQKVLSKLSKKANGDYLLFTDGDMLFNPDWIQGMLGQVENDKQLIVGLTKVSGSRWLDRMQNIDWLINEYIVAWFTNWNVGLTAWGNNMLISKTTYEAIGGHEGLDKTIVEDVDLLRKVYEYGGQLVVNNNSRALASTKPQESISQIANQRRRWAKGLSGVNPIFYAGFLVKLLFWPAQVFLILVNPVWLLTGLIGFGLKKIILDRTPMERKGEHMMSDLLMFEIYDFAFYLFTFAFVLYPTKISWKGRKYS